MQAQGQAQGQVLDLVLDRGRALVPVRVTGLLGRTSQGPGRSVQAASMRSEPVHSASWIPDDHRKVHGVGRRRGAPGPATGRACHRRCPRSRRSRRLHRTCRRRGRRRSPRLRRAARRRVRESRLCDGPARRSSRAHRQVVRCRTRSRASSQTTRRRAPRPGRGPRASAERLMRVHRRLVRRARGPRRQDPLAPVLCGRAAASSAVSARCQARAHSTEPRRRPAQTTRAATATIAAAMPTM